MANGSVTSGIHLRDYLRVLYKRRWTLASFFFIVVTIITLGAFMQTSIYQAAATVQILPEAPKVVNFKEVVALGSNNYWANKEYYETQFRIIRSRSVTSEVLQKLDLLDKEPYKSSKDPETTLADQIRVEPVKNSQLVAISVEHPNPELAAELANTVAETYRDQNLRRTRSATEDVGKWLVNEGGEQREKLEKSEAKLQEFLETHEVLSFDEKYNVALRKFTKFSEALDEAKRRRIESQAAYEDSRALQSSGKAMMIPEVMANELVQQLRNERVLAEQEMAKLRLKYKALHPRIRALQEQIDLLDEKIGGEINNTVGTIRTQYILAQSQEEELSKAVEEARNDAQQLNQLKTQYNVLRRDVDDNQGLYDELSKRAKETEITGNLAANNIVIIERARVPEHHIKPRRRTNVMLGILLGIVGGIGLAFFLEYLDNTIKTQLDIERITDVPFLGIIPSFQSDEDEGVFEDLHTHLHPKSSITESCRAIRTNIMYSSPGQEIHRLLVTSAGPQEGKSTTVINMGITFAQGGRRVCIVDSDLRRPRLHKAFNIDRSRGLTSLVMGESELEETVMATEVPNLFLLPSGPIPPNPAELLGSEQCHETLRRLDEHFDLVLFDSPPVVAVTDAAVLSRLVDGTIVVVKAGKTTTEMFKKALRQLEDVKSHTLGSILNDFNLRGEGYRYYYYYYHYRSDEGGPDDGRRRRRRLLDEIKKSA
ncbi:MAG: polysaccharide biosynthesis tyrosine autokinase [Deltaproteobacteria bacterium]|nr:polysaccharide biosynthesis tyrosine autokinase [Deltaproteobacteria bacterium]MCB9478280.1 polysaccharide biosynthesis tyrosine autokinase [Deltaproteobacteria bacterium]MCB9487168.1 polysaccharide biosynthesis tyrosine autokinase [Deltaproteobacteria bacterium]